MTYSMKKTMTYSSIEKEPATKCFWSNEFKEHLDKFHASLAKEDCSDTVVPAEHCATPTTAKITQASLDLGKFHCPKTPVVEYHFIGQCPAELQPFDLPSGVSICSGTVAPTIDLIGTKGIGDIVDADLFTIALSGSYMGLQSYLGIN